MSSAHGLPRTLGPFCTSSWFCPLKPLCGGGSVLTLFYVTSRACLPYRHLTKDAVTMPGSRFPGPLNTKGHLCKKDPICPQKLSPQCLPTTPPGHTHFSPYVGLPQPSLDCWLSSCKADSCSLGNPRSRIPVPRVYPSHTPSGNLPLATIPSRPSSSLGPTAQPVSNKGEMTCAHGHRAPVSGHAECLALCSLISEPS